MPIDITLKNVVKHATIHNAYKKNKFYIKYLICLVICKFRSVLWISLSTDVQLSTSNISIFA